VDLQSGDWTDDSKSLTAKKVKYKKKNGRKVSDFKQMKKGKYGAPGRIKSKFLNANIYRPTYRPAGLLIFFYTCKVLVISVRILCWVHVK